MLDEVSQLNVVSIGYILVLVGFLIWFRSLMYSCGGGFRDCGLCRVPLMFWGGICLVAIGIATSFFGVFFPIIAGFFFSI